MNKTSWKSIGAVFAGIVVNVVLATATDFALEAAGIFPPISNGLFVTWMLVLALAYRTLYAVVGGYITAKLAPHSPMNHVTWLIGVGTVMGTLGAVVGWNMSAHWYPILLVITSVAGTWVGGKLYIKR